MNARLEARSVNGKHHFIEYPLTWGEPARGFIQDYLYPTNVEGLSNCIS